MISIPKINISVRLEGDLSQQKQITSSYDASNTIREMFNPDTFNWQEEFVLICMNNSNKIMSYYPMSKGSMTGTLVDIRMLFTTALNSLATSIIVAHNHPSGKTQPSHADRDLTKKIKQAGEIMDIRLLDHLIITRDSYYSFADNGEL